MHEKLRIALDAAKASRELYCADCLVVWHELCAVEPELTDAILELGLDEPVAAQWVCQLGKDARISARRRQRRSTLPCVTWSGESFRRPRPCGCELSNSSLS